MSKFDPVKLHNYTISDAYPLTTQQVIHQARQRGADEELVTLMDELPETSYKSHDDVIHAIREVEASRQLGVWRTREPNTVDTSGEGSAGSHAASTKVRNRVDTALDESFPASDPPSWTGGSRSGS